ncbi:MAG: hypothetical protein ABR907_05870 [Terracidiphilus sp.]|jgi:hypothetical protein
MSLNLTIDRLALGGFDPAERAAFEQGLRSGLASALADTAMQAQIYSRSSTVRSIPVLRLGKVTLQPGISGARNLGIAVARAVGNSGAISVGGSRAASLSHASGLRRQRP